MSATFKTNTPAPTGAPQFNARLNGFPKRGLVNLFRFTEAAPGTAYFDDVTGTSTTPVLNAGGFGTAAVTALPGGGTRLLNRSGVPFKTQINNSQPWTIIAGMALQPNSTATPNGRAAYLLTTTAVASAIDQGLTAYQTVASSSLTTATPLPFTQPREFASGGSSFTAVPAVSGLNYGAGFMMVATHYGSGVGALKFMRGGAVVARSDFTMNLTLERGTPATDLMTYAIGGAARFDALDLYLEGMAQYAVALTAAEEVIAYNAVAALAALPARNRAFV